MRSIGPRLTVETGTGDWYSPASLTDEMSRKIVRMGSSLSIVCRVVKQGGMDTVS